MSTVSEAPMSLAGVEVEPVAPTPYVVSAATFGRMLDAEVFDDADRVELHAGQIYQKMAKTQAHAVAGNLANRILTQLVPDGWFVGGENPITINQTRVPLPDLVVLRGTPRDYLDQRPTPGAVGLIVEFSLSSLKADTGAKLADYAAANIPVYWVFNLVDNLILVFHQPVPAEARYESAQTYTVGQAVPLRLDGNLIAHIPAADLLPVRP